MKCREWEAKVVEDATLGNAAFKGVEEEKHKKETEEET